LASRLNGLRNFEALCGRKDPEDIGGWFFEAFEQSIEGLAGQHVDLVNDENPVAVPGRAKLE
jgi:hypothetical protein